jgi:hypothetical protein
MTRKSLTPTVGYSLSGYSPGEYQRNPESPGRSFESKSRGIEQYHDLGIEE